MKSLYVSFLQRLLVFSAILGAIAIILYLVMGKAMLTPVLPFLFCFFTAVTLISYYLQLKSTNERFIRYVNAYMLITAGKLLLYALVIIGYVFTHRGDAVPFMIAFFILYLCYTIFEVITLIGSQGKAGGK